MRINLITKVVGLSDLLLCILTKMRAQFYDKASKNSKSSYIPRRFSLKRTKNEKRCELDYFISHQSKTDHACMHGFSLLCLCRKITCSVKIPVLRDRKPRKLLVRFTSIHLRRFVLWYPEYIQTKVVNHAINVIFDCLPLFYNTLHLSVTSSGFELKSAYSLPPDWKENIPYTLDSVQRYCYQNQTNPEQLQLPTNRYGSNTKKHIPASGTSKSHLNVSHHDR